MNANFLSFPDNVVSKDLSSQITHGVRQTHFLPNSGYKEVLQFANVEGSPGLKVVSKAHTGTKTTQVKIEGNTSGQIGFATITSVGTLKG